MAKKPISARIDEDTLMYIKGCHQPINTLINVLLKKWMKDRQDKELLIWKEVTGQDELSQMAKNQNLKVSQSCKNCKYLNETEKYCRKLNYWYTSADKKTFCCIYWDKKKGSR